jgi:tetraacyldisaccharide 4'-kinase
LLSRLLLPLGAVYGEITSWRMRKASVEAGVPVFCVGNYHLGGAGKTPTTLALVDLLRELGEQPVVLSRGYGGRLRGPIGVDLQRHSAADVGDEPLMMARDVPVVIARDRVDGAALARAKSASVIVMDDGFQNPALVKHVSLIVIDSRRGVGNACVFPAGPLRAPLPLQIERTDALIVIGDGDAADGIAAEISANNGLVLRARLQPDEASVARLKGRRVLAFAGIGDPARFFATLRASGVDIVEQRAFPDHHPFTADDMSNLAAIARRDDLALVTTEKDLARIGPAAASSGYDVTAFAVALEVEDAARLRLFVLERLNEARASRFVRT